MRLSTHFSLAEFTRSETALRRGIPNVPTEEHIANLTRLCVEVLEPVRGRMYDRYGQGTIVRITSGYRAPDLNAAVGGSRTSAHMDGRAADIEVYANGREQNVLDVFAMVRTMGLPLDQLIQECGPSGWNHIGIAPVGAVPRGDLLVATGSPGAWKYSPAPAVTA